MWQDISRFGAKLVALGLTHSHYGNISIRLANRVLITRTGAMLDEIDERSVIEVDLHEVRSQDALASSETIVHRAIYRNTEALAIVHTHSPHAVALSLVADLFLEPVDSVGLHLLGRIPVVEGEIGSEELAEGASAALKLHKACIARGHGVFATGKTLKDAYFAACTLEHSAQILYLVGMWERRSV
jgi:L-fuculose-phosphate aldolase